MKDPVSKHFKTPLALILLQGLSGFPFRDSLWKATQDACSGRQVYHLASSMHSISLMSGVESPRTKNFLECRNKNLQEKLQTSSVFRVLTVASVDRRICQLRAVRCRYLHSAHHNCPDISEKSGAWTSRTFIVYFCSRVTAILAQFSIAIFLTNVAINTKAVPDCNVSSGCRAIYVLMYTNPIFQSVSRLRIHQSSTVDIELGGSGMLPT